MTLQAGAKTCDVWYDLKGRGMQVSRAYLEPASMVYAAELMLVALGAALYPCGFVVSVLDFI